MTLKSYLKFIVLLYILALSKVFASDRCLISILQQSLIDGDHQKTVELTAKLAGKLAPQEAQKIDGLLKSLFGGEKERERMIQGDLNARTSRRGRDSYGRERIFPFFYKDIDGSMVFISIPEMLLKPTDILSDNFNTIRATRSSKLDDALFMHPKNVLLSKFQQINRKYFAKRIALSLPIDHLGAQMAAFAIPELGKEDVFKVRYNQWFDTLMQNDDAEGINERLLQTNLAKLAFDIEFKKIILGFEAFYTELFSGDPWLYRHFAHDNYVLSYAHHLVRDNFEAVKILRAHFVADFVERRHLAPKEANSLVDRLNGAVLSVGVSEKMESLIDGNESMQLFEESRRLVIDHRLRPQ